MDTISDPQSFKLKLSRTFIDVVQDADQEDELSPRASSDPGSVRCSRDDLTFEKNYVESLADRGSTRSWDSPTCTLDSLPSLGDPQRKCQVSSGTLDSLPSLGDSLASMESDRKFDFDPRGNRDFTAIGVLGQTATLESIPEFAWGSQSCTLDSLPSMDDDTDYATRQQDNLSPWAELEEEDDDIDDATFGIADYGKSGIHAQASALQSRFEMTYESVEALETEAKRLVLSRIANLGPVLEQASDAKTAQVHNLPACMEFEVVNDTLFLPESRKLQAPNQRTGGDAFSVFQVLDSVEEYTKMDMAPISDISAARLSGIEAALHVKTAQIPASTAAGGVMADVDVDACSGQGPLEFTNSGSLGHPHLCRRVCLYRVSGKCVNGDACTFCHYPHTGIVGSKNLDKKKREALKQLSFEEVVALLLPLIQGKIAALAPSVLDAFSEVARQLHPGNPPVVHLRQIRQLRNSLDTMNLRFLCDQLIRIAPLPEQREAIQVFVEECIHQHIYMPVAA